MYVYFSPVFEFQIPIIFKAMRIHLYPRCANLRIFDMQVEFHAASVLSSNSFGPSLRWRALEIASANVSVSSPLISTG